jgi:hypothetical protein
LHEEELQQPQPGLQGRVSEVKGLEGAPPIEAAPGDKGNRGPIATGPSGDPAAFSRREETAMSLDYNRRKPDRRFGFVLIAIFTLGILGGSVATFLNGGEVPVSHTAIVDLTKTTAPL